MKDAYQLSLQFQGKDWKTYDFITTDFERVSVLHKDLKPADGSVKFSLLPSIETNNLLLDVGEYDVPVKITKNGAAFFTGFLKKNFSIQKGQRLQPVSLEAVTGGYLLKQKVGRDIFIGKKKRVTDTVKEIIDLAGVEHTAIPVIDDIVYGVHIKPADSFHGILTALLFEYGYTFYFDDAGFLSFVPLFLRNPEKQYTINGRQTLELIQLEHSEHKKTEVSVAWDGVEIIEDNYAFIETQGAQMGYSCYIELLPASYYRGAPDGIYIPYQSRYGEVILAENVRLDIDGDMSDIAVQEFAPFNTKALVKIKNKDNSFSKWIRRLNFKADKVYVKKSKNKSKAARNTTNNKVHEVKAHYIYTKARAESLANDLLNYYRICILKYKIKTKISYPLGATATIEDYGIGRCLVRIIEKAQRLSSGEYEYTAERVGEYKPADASFQMEALPRPQHDGRDGQDGAPGKEGKPGKDGKDGYRAAFPIENRSFLHFRFDAAKKTAPAPSPSYTAWQSRIIEYDCTDMQEIAMPFKEARHAVIILKGSLHNDFTLRLFFDAQSGNGAKQYHIVYALTGDYTLTITSGIQRTRTITQPISAETYGAGCFCVLDAQGNVWHFRGEKGAGGVLVGLEDAASIDDGDFFITQRKNLTQKVNKEAALYAIQRYDSPIGEIKTFYDGEYKHGFLEANGLPFSPDVFPEFTAYVKRVFNTGADPITGWPLRPKLAGQAQGIKVFLKAVQGV